MDNRKIIKNYIILSKLGIGSYGVVYKVKKINTNNIYVIKQIPYHNFSPKQIYAVKQEANILASINSKYVVKYYESFEINNSLNIVMEYCDGGDLSIFLKKNKKTKILLLEDLIWTLFLKITIGLASIHNLKILHRDLKTLNIFLTKNLDIKIGDLGVAKILTETKFAKTFIGTPYYLSPEICKDYPYNDKSDIWALGCILYELCTYRHPFESRSQASLILKILNETPSPIYNYYSDDLQELIYMLLEKNERLRPSCYDILTMPNIMEKCKQYGLYDEIINLYPFIINNNIIYQNEQNNEDQYSYNDNKIGYYIDNGYTNNSMYEINYNGFNKKYHYNDYEDNKNKNYHLNNYEQNFIIQDNQNNDNGNNSRNRMYYNNGQNSNINYYLNNQNGNENNNEVIDGPLAHNENIIFSSYAENIKNHNKKINNMKKNFVRNNSIEENNNKVNIIPMLKPYKGNLNNNYSNNFRENEIFKRGKNCINHKIIYIDSKNLNKYNNKNIQDKNYEELYINNLNDKNKINNIQNNISEKKLESDNHLNKKKEIDKKYSDNKNKHKALNSITEFANSLNNYVEQHNLTQKNKNKFQYYTIESTIEENEECPKDIIKNINKTDSKRKNISDISFRENDCYKIINEENNNEEVKANDEEENNKIFNNVSSNSKVNDSSLNISNNISNIDSSKINLILQNHQNLKILKNLENNKEEQNNKEKEKEKSKDNEEILNSSEEEKNYNLYDSEEESEEDQNEIIKEAEECKSRESNLNKSLTSNEENKNKLNNEKEYLEEKIRFIKNDILKLIGEEDYNYFINFYSKIENNSDEVEEINNKIEEYIKSKYEDEKGKTFFDLYFSLKEYDNQLTEKEHQLQKYI